MISKKFQIIATTLLAMIVALVSVSGLTYAQSGNNNGGNNNANAAATNPIKSGVEATCPAGGCPQANGSVNDLVSKIIDIFSWVVGVVSVIMIIFGGFKYITSGGDAGKVTSAKNTIIYALVGLVIVALAQVIVLFVLGNVTKQPKDSNALRTNYTLQLS